MGVFFFILMGEMELLLDIGGIFECWSCLSLGGDIIVEFNIFIKLGSW